MQRANDPAETRDVSPLVLTQLIMLFGDQPDPAHPSVRFPLRGCTAVIHHPEDDHPSERVRVFDVSLGGIGFESNEILSIDSRVAIEFETNRIVLMLWPCSVTRVTETERGTYHVGASFDFAE